MFHSRFEEVLAEVEKVKPSKDSKKRPRESDVADADESKPSKAEKKKANKKLKADESGKAVPTAKDEIPAEAKVNGEDKKKDKKLLAHCRLVWPTIHNPFSLWLKRPQLWPPPWPPNNCWQARPPFVASIWRRCPILQP